MVSTRSDSLIPHEIRRLLGRTAALISVDNPEAWYQFEAGNVEPEPPPEAGEPARPS